MSKPRQELEQSLQAAVPCTDLVSKARLLLQGVSLPRPRHMRVPQVGPGSWRCTVLGACVETPISVAAHIFSSARKKAP